MDFGSFSIHSIKSMFFLTRSTLSLLSHMPTAGRVRCVSDELCWASGSGSLLQWHSDNGKVARGEEACLGKEGKQGTVVPVGGRPGVPW